MALTFNIRHLEKGPLRLAGELSATELDIGDTDELVHAREPLSFDLTVERIGPKDILVQGRLAFNLDCECARCLKAFQESIHLDSWALDLPLEGEEQVEVVNDCVDLTPFIREDTLLAFPQHPLCETTCSGLPYAPASAPMDHPGETNGADSAWAVLNKLKF